MKINIGRMESKYGGISMPNDVNMPYNEISQRQMRYICDCDQTEMLINLTIIRILLYIGPI